MLHLHERSAAPGRVLLQGLHQLQQIGLQQLRLPLPAPRLALRQWLLLVAPMLRRAPLLSSPRTNFTRRGATAPWSWTSLTLTACSDRRVGGEQGG